MENDLISRQAAYDALMAEPLKWDDSSVWESARCHQWMMDMGVIKALPSAQQEAISLEWIDKHLEWLDNCDNDFAQLAKVGIRAMVELWKKDRT